MFRRVIRAFFFLSLGLSLLAACGDSGQNSSSVGGASASTGAQQGASTTTVSASAVATSGSATTSSGAGGGTGCTPVSLGAFVLSDTQTGGSSLTYDVSGLTPNVESVLYVEFFDTAGPQAAGAFDLSLSPDDNYKTCAHCLLVFDDVNGAKPTAYFPVSGTLHVTTPDVAYSGASSGSFDGVKLVEVTVSGGTTTPVPGGKCISLDGAWSHSP